MALLNRNIVEGLSTERPSIENLLYFETDTEKLVILNSDGTIKKHITNMDDTLIISTIFGK